MLITMEQIRMRYPHPRISHERYGNRTPAYCTGGACVKMALRRGRLAGVTGLARSFPGVFTLRDALYAMNPALPPEVATRLAERIIAANDVGNFVRAWEIVEEALTYRQ